MHFNLQNDEHAFIMNLFQGYTLSTPKIKI